MPITDILPDKPANTQNPPGQCPETGVNLGIFLSLAVIAAVTDLGQRHRAGAHLGAA